MFGRPDEIRSAVVMRAVLAIVLALAAVVPAAVAQPYPNRAIRILVGFPPGGATDIVARLVANGLSLRLGQPVVVENRAGSGGNLAAEIAAKSAPDGYTLAHGPDSVFIVNPHVYARMPFDPLKDFVPVSSLSANQLVLAVHSEVPAHSLTEFVELARRTSPPLFYASIGNGSQHHLAMELLKRHVGIELTHVPYRGGGPAAIGLLGREVSTMFGGGSIVPTIRSGKARGLASTGKTRYAMMPELPTIGEIYPGYEVPIWHGWFAPVGTPVAILERLRTEINFVLSQPEFAERLAASGSGEPYISTPEAFAARIRADHDKFGALVKSIGMRVD